VDGMLGVHTAVSPSSYSFSAWYINEGMAVVDLAFLIMRGSTGTVPTFTDIKYAQQLS
jgi:hypothetical protein